MEMDRIIEGEGQRREYSRVDTYIPFRYRIVADEEKNHIQARISGDTAAQELRPIKDMGDHDYIVGEWLKILNLKLDTVIRLITLQREGFFGLPFKAVNISGGGISFLLSQAIAPGTILEIKLMLTRNQLVAMCIYGEVTKSMPRDDSNFLIAVRYVHMDVSIRDEIVRFVFEREREIIREKRG
jgi:c-di-GMP-binding flagellar brake protein YcgR